jgi:hypothetical protein
VVCTTARLFYLELGFIHRFHQSTNPSCIFARLNHYLGCTTASDTPQISLADAQAAAARASNSSSVTYWISRIQNLANRSLFVSLNPPTTPGGTFFDATMEHPVMDLRAFAAQEREAQHQGIDGVYHAGMRFLDLVVLSPLVAVPRLQFFHFASFR